MNYIELGTSGVKVTPIIFGAWAIGGWMWGGADKKDALKAIHKSLDMGLSSIDTAPAYGFGQSEEIVGEAIFQLKIMRANLYQFTSMQVKKVLFMNVNRA